MPLNCFWAEGYIMLFTLKNFIEDCGFSGLLLLTCPEKLDNPITGVNVIDNPDVAQWIRPGELVLTTGYFFSTDPLLQTSVIMNLKAAGCSALCLKLKRFFPEIPENILSTAEQAGLPIIDIPLEYSFSEITLKIHDALGNRQLQSIRNEQLLFNSLLNVFRSEQSLEQCLHLLSDFLSSSLFVVNSKLQCISSCLRAEDQACISCPDFSSLLPANARMPVLNPKEETYVWLRAGDYEFYAALVPFPDDDVYLCLPGNIFMASSDTILRSMKLFHLSRERLSKSPAGFSEYYSDFFRLLLSEHPEQSEIDKICHYYGYPHANSQLCILFSLKASGEVQSLQEPLEYLKNCLRGLSISSSDYFLASYRRQICLFLLSGQKGIERTAAACADVFQKKYGNLFSTGISQLVRGHRKIADAYRQAAFLISLADIFPEKTSFLFHDYLLFWNIKRLPVGDRQKILEDTIKPLIDYDAKNHADLFLTLLQYYNSQFNASLAAKELYIHRNTLLKRLAKINELILFNPDDINSLFSVYYGICVYLMESHET